MSIQELNEVCANLIQKMIQGQPLNAIERTHLSQCAGCMREVVLHLDQMAEDAAALLGTTGESGETVVAYPSPEVIEALEHGRRVFAREFGV
jgi:hypothetical protein